MTANPMTDYIVQAHVNTSIPEDSTELPNVTVQAERTKYTELCHRVYMHGPHGQQLTVHEVQVYQSHVTRSIGTGPLPSAGMLPGSLPDTRYGSLGTMRPPLLIEGPRSTATAPKKVPLGKDLGTDKVRSATRNRKGIPVFVKSQKRKK
jgi:hypothetical protein